MDAEKYKLVGEVAEELRVTRRTVRRWVRSGKIKAERPAKFWLIPESEIMRLKQNPDGL